MPRPHVQSDAPSEVEYKGRFFLCMTDNHLKIIDLKMCRLYDLLSEPKFDQQAVHAMGLSRSAVTRKSTLLLLCLKEVEDAGAGTMKSYIQQIEFNDTLPYSLSGRITKQ